ncbi:MAG: hypothetical protein V8R08_00930 [Coriobacteriales bacterium]
MGMSKITLKEFAIEYGKRYFVRAIPLMLALFLLAKIAPDLPMGFLPVAIIVYAFIAMMGSLHFVVMHRTLREYKLREGGRLSRWNRWWMFSLIVLFVLGLISGFLFLLEAPEWGSLEWTLILSAVLVYFVIFALLFLRLRREFTDRFDKTYAMKWAFWFTGIFLCILCAVISAFEAPPEVISMYGAFQEVELFFDDSSCALLSELEYLTSFFEGLKAYVMHNMAGGHILVAVIIKVVLFAPVFFGLMSQFCFCLLSRDEIAAEFHELSATGVKRDAKQLPAIRYLVILSALILAFFVAFFCC